MTNSSVPPFGADLAPWAHALPSIDGPVSSPTLTDEDRQRFQGIADQRDRDLLASFRTAARLDPDVAGEAQRVAAQLGKPVKQVEIDLDVARGVLLERQLRDLRLREAHPMVMQAIENPNFLRISYDDLENLTATDSVWQSMGRAWDAGRATNERGYIGSRIAMGLGTDKDRERLAELRDTIGNAQRDTGFLAGSAELLGQMAGTTTTALAAGSAAAGLASLGGPVSAGAAFTWTSGAAFFTQTALIEGGNAYLDLMETPGMNEDTAGAVALGVGLVNGVLELAGAKVVAKPFQGAVRNVGRRLTGGLAQETAGRAFASALGEYAKGLGGEMTTEVLQEIANITGEAIARPDGAPEPSWAEIRGRLYGIASKTFQGMALLGLPGPAVHYFSQNRRAEAALQRADAFEKASTLAAASKVRQRNPDQHAAFAQAVAAEQGVQEVFVDAARFRQALDETGTTDAELRAQLPEVFRQLEDAEANQEREADVVVPAGEWLSKVAQTKVGAALQPDVRFDRDAMSRREAEQHLADRPALAAAAREAISQSEAEDLAFRDSGQKVEDALHAQIVATRALPDAKQARGAAQLYRAFYDTQAAELGITPEELHQRFPIKFVAGTQRRGTGLRSARGEFDPHDLSVLLYQKADVSTFLHEGGHFFLHVLGQLAGTDTASVRQRDDLQTLLTWRGIDSIEAWNAMSLEEQRVHHEAFAYSFEAHYFDGSQAPPGLQQLFDRFKTWLRALYRGIRDKIGANFERETGEQLPILTGEVRDVMDRLLASEEQVATAQAVREMVPLFQTQEQAGMTDEEWADYQAMDRLQFEAALRLRDQDQLRQMKWLSGARSRKLKEIQARAAVIRERVRREVIREVASTPRDRARRWLLNGKLLREDGKTVTEPAGTVHKLDTDAVRQLLPAGVAITTTKLRRLHQKGGLNPDAVAEQFGFRSGESLVRALLEMEPFEAAVKRRTDERMVAEHSELADPGEVEAALERALGNEVRARQVAVELRHLERLQKPWRVQWAAAKEAARQAVAKLRVADLSPRRFAMAEVRARRKAAEAQRRGDDAGVILWKRRELLQHAMVAVVGETKQKLDQQVRQLGRFERPDDKIAKTRDTRLVNAARWILSRFNLASVRQEQTAQASMDAVRSYDPTMYAMLEPLLIEAATGSRDYRELTVEQAQQLMAQVDGLWNQAKRTREIEIDGRREAKADAISKVLAKLLPRIKGDGKVRTPTAAERRGRAFGSIKAVLRHQESLALEWDGGDAGDVHRYLFAMLRDPYDTYQTEKNRLVKELFDKVAKLQGLGGPKIEATEIDEVFQNRAELLGALLHAGNDWNLRKNGVGRGWFQPPQEEGERVDTSAWHRFLQRMLNEGKLTKADLDFAQSVWDTFETELKPRVQGAWFDNYGVYMSEVPADAFTVTIDGERVTYRGGYFPATADSDHVDPQQGEITVDGVMEQASAAALERYPSTSKGFGIQRTEIYRPLMQDVRLAAKAFDQELRFIYLQRPGRDIAAILNNQEVAAAIRRLDPNAMQHTIRPWLQDTMNNRVMAPTAAPAWWTRFLVMLRRNVGIATMFGNVANALQQVTGLANSAAYVPRPFLRAAAARYAGGPRDLAKAVTEESKFMRLRLDDQVGQLVDDLTVLTSPSKFGTAQNWLQRNGYFLQRWMQNPVDLITWAAARDHATAQGKDATEAVRWADSVVRRSQGSGTAADVSKVERASAFGRLFTQFATFWISQFNAINQQQTLQGKALLTLWLVGVNGVVAGAISQALRGGWDDEDEDGAYWDDVTAWAFGEVGSAGSATLVPIGGPMLYSLLTGNRGGRLSPGATWGAVERSGKALRSLFLDLPFDAERELRGQDVKDVATLFALVTGVPLPALAKPVGYAVDVARGAVQPTGVVDAARGAVTGAASPGSR